MRFQTLEEVTTPNGVLEFGPVVARPIRTVQARQEFFLIEQSGRPIFGQTTARQSLQSRNSAQQLILTQHLKAVKALAPLWTSCAFPSLPPKMGRTP